MNKIIKHTALSFLMLLSLFSCSELDSALEGDVPSIFVEASILNGGVLANGGDVVATDTVDFLFSVNSPGGFSAVLIGGGANTSITKSDIGALDATQQVDGIAYRVFTTEEDGGATATFIFVATDEIGQISDSLEFNFNIISLADENDDIQLLGLENGSGASFFDTIEGEIYDLNNAENNSDKLDLFFYHGDEAGYALASLESDSSANVISEQTASALVDFSERNGTQFKTFNSIVNFDAIRSVVDLENEFENPGISGLAFVTELEIGDIIGFQLDEARTGRIGLIRINSLDGNSASDRSIQFDLKMEVE